MQRILFVCLGNICRSPLAEGIAKAIIKRKGYTLEVDSAGTSGWHAGEAPCPRSVEVAAKNGIDISTLRARQVTKADKKNFDRIIALDSANKAELEALGFRNVELLGMYGGFGGKDVPDPYYFDDNSGFEEVFSMIMKATEDLLEKVDA
jgi:protein-tyrosine phosphatase